VSRPSTVPASVQADLLAMRLDGLRDRVRLLVEQRSADDPDVHDPWRGLRHTADSVERLLDRKACDPGALPPLAGAATPAASRLEELALRFGLTPLDVEILLVALAPDLDRAFEACYGYLNDDVTRRRATVGLALELAGLSGFDAGGRGRFGATAPLLAWGLVVLEDAERPLLTRALRVPDRVAGYLVGDDAPDDALAGMITVAEPDPRVPPDLSGVPAGFVGALAEFPRPAAQAGPGRGGRPPGGPLLAHLRERRPGTPGAADALAVAALHAAGRTAVLIDVTSATLERAASLAPVLAREARLRGAGLVVNLVEPADPGPLCHPEVPVLLVGEARFGPVSEHRPLVLEIGPNGDPPGLWRAELGRIAPDVDLAVVTAPYRMTSRAVRAAARTARALADVDGTAVTAAHIHRGVRLENVVAMGTGVRRVEPAVGWDDLVLPDEPSGRLRELVDRVRHRDRVLGTWRLRTGGGRGRGVTALFVGESGTGKTLAAEVIARELGLDLYVTELSALVDKYVGETEKNLERLFTQAERVNTVLLFDEADAVFGKRSETKDAHDRYANMESSYLLQRLESFDGVAVLTTNLRGNIDDAFTRRFDLVVDFPFPDKELRRALWAGCLSDPVPVAGDIDLDRVAGEFELAGGSIRAAATTAAYLAAAAGRPVGMGDVLAGARREYRKLGRLVEAD
jgi:hypothetical protein